MIRPHVVSRTDLASETRQLGDCANTVPNAYTIVNVEDAEAAVAMAGRWNLLQHGGGIEVRRLTTSPFQLEAPTRQTR